MSSRVDYARVPARATGSRFGGTTACRFPLRQHRTADTERPDSCWTRERPPRYEAETPPPSRIGTACAEARPRRPRLTQRTNEAGFVQPLPSPPINMMLRVSIPPGNQRGPQYMEQALAAMYHGLHRRHGLTLLIGHFASHVGLAIEGPHPSLSVVQQQFFAHYPECELRPIAVVGNQPTGVWSAAVRLAPDIFPIRTHEQFEDALNRTTADPLAALLSAAAGNPDSPHEAWIEIHVRPVQSFAHWRAKRLLRSLDRPVFHRWHGLAFWYARSRRSTSRVARFCAGLLQPFILGQPAQSSAPSAWTEHLHAGTRKLGSLIFEVTLTLRVTGPSEHLAAAHDHLHGMIAALGAFTAGEAATFAPSRIRAKRHRPRRSDRFLLSAAEVATLWHPASETVQTAAMDTVDSRQLEPPVELPAATGETAMLGTTAYRGELRPFGMLPDDRRRHLAILGKTGMGKTTLLQSLITADIQAGRGVGIVDPHGDLAETILAAVPRSRTNDVILFDAADAKYPVAFNPLACSQRHQRPLVAGAILSTFKKLYGDSWGPRLEHILRNTLFTLLDLPGASLLLVPRLLTDGRFRSETLQRTTDPVVREFWEREFAQLPPKLQAEATAPVLNKVGQFLTNPVLRNILGQPKSRLDLRTAMDDGKILLVNLSKGRLGEDASTLLGSFLITAVQLAAMSRADVDESRRRDFYLYVDEFGCFATEAFAGILSEARKYRLNLTVANQYLAQLSEGTLAAVFGNVGSLLAFQLGPQDAETLAEQLGAPVEPADLMMLPKYHAYARLLIDGQPSRPFTMRTVAPIGAPVDPARPDIVRRVSRRRYAGTACATHRILGG